MAGPLDLRNELENAGIFEANFDPTKKEHRLAVGAVILQRMRERFPSAKRILHMGDTSRLDSGQVDGECTVRDTGDETLRGPQCVAHMDKHLPGIAECFGLAGSHHQPKELSPSPNGLKEFQPPVASLKLRAAAGARHFSEAYEALNGDVWRKAGVSKEDVGWTVLHSPGTQFNINKFWLDFLLEKWLEALFGP